MKASISNGHPLARCVVTSQFSASGLPVRLTDVVLSEATGVRLRYLGEPNVVVDGVAEFISEIVLTMDLPEGKKLSGTEFEYVFIPDYMSQ